MKHEAFDRELRERARQEHFEASASAEQKLDRAICRARQAGAADRPRRRAGARMTALAAAAAVCAAALILAAIRPHDDLLRGTVAQPGPAAVRTAVPLAQPRRSAVPQAAASAWLAADELTAEAEFRNDTGEIWLIEWSAEAEGAAVEAPDGLLWLEPGAICTDRAVWSAEGTGAGREVTWRWAGYRVEAGMLHWIDGDWLRPGQEGYADQQALIGDAYENGALILCAGDWENGMAGEMTLVRPDDVADGATALEHYVRAGLLFPVGHAKGGGTLTACGALEPEAAPRMEDGSGPLGAAQKGEVKRP